MTFWATLYYAGRIVMVLGAEGQTLEQCETLKAMVLRDISISYIVNAEELSQTQFPTNRFTAHCALSGSEA